MKGHKVSVETAAIAEVKGRVVAVSAWGPGRIRTWNLKTGRKLRTFRAAGDYIQDIAATTIEGHPAAITGSNDSVVCLWDLKRRKPRVFQGHTGRVFAVAAGVVNGRPVAISGDARGFLRRWDLRTETGPSDNDPAQGASSLAFTRLNGRVAVIAGTEEGPIGIWDLAKRIKLGTLKGHTSPVRRISSAESGGRSILLSGDYHGNLKAWDLAKGTELWRLDVPSYSSLDISSLVLATLPHGGMAAITFTSHDVVVRDIPSGRQLGRIDRLVGEASREMIDLGNRPAIIFEEIRSGAPVRIHIWDLVDHTTVHMLYEEELVSRIATAKIDGRPIIVLAFHDGRIRVRDIMTGDELLTLRGAGNLSGLAVLNCKSEPLVVSTSFNGAVRAWDLSGPEEPFASIELGSPVNALAATPSGSLGAVGTPKGFLVLEIRPHEQ